MSFDLGLSGRRALVTAGTKGVGGSVIEVLRENGAKVVTTARSIPRSSLAGVHYVAANLTTAERCTLVAHSALDYLGGIDIVVNVLGEGEPDLPAIPCLLARCLAVVSRGLLQQLAGRPFVSLFAAYQIGRARSG